MSTFDYIVVGGGTAGLVVATRLSENPAVKVAVVEAGDDQSSNPVVLTPGLLAAIYGNPELDWNFMSTPQPELNGRIVNQARGKMLGGTSGLNFMMAVYPSAAVINSWGALGNEGWSFEELEPYFRRFANTQDPTPEAANTSRMHSHYDGDISAKENGPLRLGFSTMYSETNSHWFDTFEKLGLKSTADPRSGKTLGAFQQGANIDPETCMRTYAGNTYLTPEVRARENLTILTKTIVTKLNLAAVDGDDVVVTGVQIRDAAGVESTLTATKEVVLSAGTFASPQLLELSGIGAPEVLEPLNIPVIINNPAVGENVQDHPIVCQNFEVNEGVPSSDILADPNVLGAVIAMYQDGGKGPLGQSIISAAYTPVADSTGTLVPEARSALLSEILPPSDDPTHALIRDIYVHEDEPAYQMLAFPGQTNISAKPESMAEIITPVRPGTSMTLMTLLNHPFSRGTVHITSTNPNDKPTWDPAYNSNPADLELLARAVQFVETIVHTEPFGTIFKKDGKRVPAITPDSLEAAKEIVRQAQISCFHVAGSCTMRPREKGGVVDNKLKVYGTKNLRIVDASIFPIEPVGNIQTTVYAVAERAVDFIKASA